MCEPQQIRKLNARDTHAIEVRSYCGTEIRSYTFTRGILKLRFSLPAGRVQLKETLYQKLKFMHEIRKAIYIIYECHEIYTYIQCVSKIQMTCMHEN